MDRNQLIIKYLPLVKNIARKRKGYNLPMEDLIQEGTVGLIKAIDKFDPTLNKNLAAFASPYIMSEIYSYIISNYRIAKVATTKSQIKVFYNLRKLSPDVTWNTNADTTRIAKELRVPASEVVTVESRMRVPDVSFDAPIGAKDLKNVTIRPPSEYLHDPMNSPEVILEGEQLHAYQTSVLQKGISKLDKRTRMVIEKRYMTNKKITLLDLGKLMGITGEAVRLIEVQGLNIIRGCV